MGDIVVLGAKGVGKTAFVKRLCENKFEDKYLPTVGVQVYRPNNSTSLNVWDLSGDDKYSGLREMYYQTTHHFVLMIDVTKNQEVNNKDIEQFLNELSDKDIVPPKTPIYLVATKTDEKDRQLSSKQIKELASEYNLILPKSFECSAKEKNSVNNVFNSILKVSVENAEEQQVELKIYEKVAAKKANLLANFVNTIRCYLDQPKNAQKMQLQQESLELHYALENNLINSQAINQEIRRLFITESQLQQLKSLADEFSKLKRINESTGLKNSCASAAILHLTKTVRIVKMETKEEVVPKAKTITKEQQTITDAIVELQKRVECLSDAKESSKFKSVAENLKNATDLYFKAPSKSAYQPYRKEAEQLFEKANEIVNKSKESTEKLSKIRFSLKAIKSSIDIHGVIYGFFYHLTTYGLFTDQQKFAEKQKATAKMLKESIFKLDNQAVNESSDSIQLEDIYTPVSSLGSVNSY